MIKTIVYKGMNFRLSSPLFRATIIQINRIFLLFIDTVFFVKHEAD